ncbi:protein ECT2 [Dermacentor silvarum]|uniref:protein ECT2 n=1 Tax=Dermacentor silvarum TaxID=543639 RepID=UPI00210090AB|nr:protein ECT2 [Dermacentor silvarum]
MPFPDKGRPVYNLAMDGLVIVFTGFKSRTELCELLLLSHYMGASVRDKFSSRNVTHCVADSVTSAKYELCDALDIPIMKKEWLLEAWAHRDEKDFSVTSESMMKLRLEAFRGLQLAFLGFADDERQHMEEVALANGAHVVEPTLAATSLWSTTPILRPHGSSDSIAALPWRPPFGEQAAEVAREPCQQLAQEAEQSVLVDPSPPRAPGTAGGLGQQQVCLELLQTETNYVAILHSILTLFKAPLEDPSSMPGEPLLDSAEVRLIFGHLPPIYEVHRSLQLQLQAMLRTWSDDHAVGEAVLAHREAFEKAYPPFVNSFERAKETLAQCDRQRPRFHAFLKRCQTKPECGRQTLAELMIRPIQRLGSMILLLKEIQKRTPKNNKDSEALEKAVAALNQIMLDINEGKRKTESQVAMFDIFNDIEKCPPNILSGHRYFVTSLDVVEIGEGGLSRKGDAVSLFLFSDILEVCRRRSRAGLTSRSPASSTLGRSGFPKTYKHIVMVHLYDVKRVVELTSAEDSDVKDAFGLVLRLPTEPRENLYTFVAEQSAPWRDFLCTLCQHMGKVYNVPDHSAFMKKMSVQELGLDPSSLQTTLAKALKYAAKKGEKLSRALSITRRAATPRHRLSRAVSTFISPLKSVTNQSSPLHGMRLASSSNLNDLADDSPCSSPQRSAPQVRVKSESYGPSTSKRA